MAFALIFAGHGLPRFVHWPPARAPGTVLAAYDALRPQRVSGALDETAWPSIMPTQSESWIGAPRLDIRRAGVTPFCAFTVTGIAIRQDERQGVDVSDGVDGAAHTVTQQVPVVTVTASDTEQGVELSWTAELLPGGLIRQRTTLRNLPAGNLPTGDLEVGKVELGFPLPALATEILTTTGHHLRERSPQRQPLTEGRFEKVSMAGRPGFDASLLLSAGEPGFGFEHGEVYSVHVGWSGNSVLSAERQPYTTGLIGGGEVLLGGEATLARGETYTTPWLYGSYGDGLNEVAARFHDYVRSCHPDLAVKPRPVILNTWEAVYFDHDYDTLKLWPIRPGIPVSNGSWWMTAGSLPPRLHIWLGDWQIAQDVWPDGPKSLKRSPITCTEKAWSSACGSNRRWSTRIPTWPAPTLTGCCARRRTVCRCRDVAASARPDQSRRLPIHP